MVRLILLGILIVFSAGPAKADGKKEFLTSCAYGVMAGTLVGTATLAFSDKPGENLQAIARGASLGLYAGILLGAYVVYIVPGQLEEGLDEEYDSDIPLEGARLQIYPNVSRNMKVDGISIGYRLLDF